MGVAVLVAQVVLAAVFLVSGAAKVYDRAGVRRAAGDFGVPAALTGLVAGVLPVVEIALGATVLPPVTARWSALGMIGLLVVFIAGIVIAIGRGRRPDCRCFGQVHSAPVGWKTVARNVVLALIAAGAWWGISYGQAAVRLPALKPVEWLLVVALVILTAAVAVQSWLLANLLRQQGRLLLRLDALQTAANAAPAGHNGHNGRPASGLPLGADAPEFELPGLHGETLTLEALRAQKLPVLLVFADHSCGPCAALLPEVVGWQDQHRDKLTIAVLSRGEVQPNLAMAEKSGVRLVLRQKSFETAEAYRFAGTPSAVLVTADGRIASATVAGAEAIRNLVTGIVSPQPQPQPQPAAQPGPPAVGQAAPGFALPDLAGHTVALDVFRGHRVMLLFWNPQCGFCARMLDDLKAWETRNAPGTPRLVVISTGTEAQNRDIGVRAPVLTDTGNTVATAFGAHGTPMAVLIDADGNIASNPAAGADAVFDLAANLLTRATN